MSSYDIEWRKQNPDAYRSIILKHRYGITTDDYRTLLSKQNNVCAICLKPEKEKRKKYLSIDHCHITNKVRGLLCDTCNKGLGLFQDDSELLVKAAEYLNWSKTH